MKKQLFLLIAAAIASSIIPSFEGQVAFNAKKAAEPSNIKRTSIQNNGAVISFEQGDGGGSSATHETTASQLSLSTKTSLQSYRSLSVGSDFDSEGWSAGVCGHFFRMNAQSIVEVNGVYSNLFDYYSKEVLQNGDAYVGTNTSYSYTYTKVETVFLEDRLT